MKRFFFVSVPTVAILFFTTAISFVSAEEPAPTKYPFPNPLKSDDLAKLIEGVRGQIFPFAITLVSLAIIYVGFRMVVAVGSGNASELTKWRKYLVYALIGAAIVAGSKTIVGAVEKFAKEISG